MTHVYTFSLFYWLCSQWNWATVLVPLAILGIIAEKS